MERFNKRNPCPICGGWDEQKRGEGTRCFGFLSDDGRYAHCTRIEEGSTEYQEKSQTYIHDMEPDGETAPPKKKRGPRTASPADWKNFKKRIEIAYEYHDEDGKVLYEVLRLRDPKSFRQRQPAEGGGWIWGMSAGEYYRVKDGGDWFAAKKNTKARYERRTFPEGRRVPYRFPQIIEDPESFVIIVEGEKSVDRLYELEADVATCSPGGAEKWKAFEESYNETFRDRHVVLIADYDSVHKKRKVRVGLEHMKQVAESLQGIAATIRLIERLPGLEEDEDVFDWLEQDHGHSLNDLLDLAERTDVYDPATYEEGDSGGFRESDLPAERSKDGKPEYEMTDLGNARRLVAGFKDLIRFCDPLGGWMLWNKIVWGPDKTGSIFRLAHRTIDLIYEEAGRHSGAAQSDLLKWAKRSQSDGAIKAMINQAQHLKDVVATPDQFDADPWILNVKNGIIDLRTSEITKHDREAFQTKVINIDYDPKAHSDKWVDFLNEMLPDGDLQFFVQRAIGYSATGLTNEERLFFVYGQTRTGKGTFVKAIESVLDEYTHTVDFETFLRQRNTSGPRNDIAGIRGKRLVFSQEVDEGRRMAESTVKSIVAGDKISARFLHKEFFEFNPVCAIWLVANHRPEVNDEDDAMWRRILQVPFSVQIAEKDQNLDLKRSLSEDDEHRQAILTWIVFGAKWWHGNGLMIPPAVREASSEYRREMDPLGEWWENNVTTQGDGLETSNADAWEDYKKWADTNRPPRELSRKAFTQRIKKKEGIEYERDGRRRFWAGFALVNAVGNFEFEDHDYET